MTVIGWIQILLFCAIVIALVTPLGGYMTRVFGGEHTFLSPILRPIEIGLYRVSGVDETREQHWLTYTVAMLFFHVAGFLVLYVLLRIQGLLPFNPAGMTAVPEALSLNTAISFITNTNWQNYGGESTLSYLTQMLGLRTRTSCRRPPASFSRLRSSAALRGIRQRLSATSGSILPAARSTSCCRSASPMRSSLSGRASRRRSDRT
jgi:K+-transporting ATPase A subunit